MNIETGALYWGDDIEKARKLGEPVVDVSGLVAGIITLGQARFNDLPQVDTPTLAELAERVSALEGKQQTAERLHTLGLEIAERL